MATNAGGLCCVKYGVTTDYVLGLDVVLADGTLVTLGGKRIKDVAGLSLLKLFVGSEGTLGIVTRVILRLIPAQPPRATLVASFPTVTAAARAVVAVGRTLRPSMLELMDAASINAVEDYKPMGLDRSAGALLIAQSDAPGAAGGRGGRGDGGGLPGRRRRRRLLPPTTRRRARCSSPPAGWPSPPSRPAARCCWRTSACRCRCCPTSSTASPPSPPSWRVEIPVVAHAGDGNTHPIIVFDPRRPGRGRGARSRPSSR